MSRVGGRPRILPDNGSYFITAGIALQFARIVSLDAVAPLELAEPSTLSAPITILEFMVCRTRL